MLLLHLLSRTVTVIGVVRLVLVLPLGNVSLATRITLSIIFLFQYADAISYP
jgi:hypothetical protein